MSNIKEGKKLVDRNKLFILISCLSFSSVSLTHANFLKNRCLSRKDNNEMKQLCKELFNFSFKYETVY